MNEHLRVEEQEVRDLIAGAGPRAVVPAEDVARIKTAVREEWREMVERERQRRRGLRVRGGLALAASVLLALAVGWWWTTRTAPVAAPVVASVELLAGSARAGGVELAVGGELAAGASVETGGWAEGAPAGAALRLSGGQSLRLAADTSVRLVSARRFELEHGTLYVDSSPTAAAGGVEVVTVLGTVRDIGTQFEVRLSEGDTAVRVRVREGKVALEAGDDSHLANPGDQLSLLGDGTVVRAKVETYGPEWEWVMATAPSIDVEGLPLSSFLAWACREIGREVRYADPDLAQAATSDILVHGSIASYTPEQALEWVMKGSGLRHQVENGTILITR